MPRKVHVRRAECLIEDRQKSNAVACALLKDSLCLRVFINLLEILVDSYLNYYLSLDVCVCFHGSVCGSVCPKKQSKNVTMYKKFYFGFFRSDLSKLDQT